MKPVITLLLSLCLFSACDSDGVSSTSSVTQKLTAAPWFFFSIDGGEGYDCVKQGNIIFGEDGVLTLNTYIRTPIYTCDGPIVTTAQYTLKENNTVVSWDGEDFHIDKLTDNEFIKSTTRGDKRHVWVYKRY
jgi:hypothetical protein